MINMIDKLSEKILKIERWIILCESEWWFLTLIKENKVDEIW